MRLTETAEKLEGSSAEDEPGGAAAVRGASAVRGAADVRGAAAVRGDTADAISEDADAVGAGGRHEAGKRERGRFAGQRENPSGECSGVGDR